MQACNCGYILIHPGDGWMGGWVVLEVVRISNRARRRRERLPGAGGYLLPSCRITTINKQTNKRLNTWGHLFLTCCKTTMKQCNNALYCNVVSCIVQCIDPVNTHKIAMTETTWRNLGDYLETTWRLLGNFLEYTWRVLGDYLIHGATGISGAIFCYHTCRA